jgi:predicted Zn-dependent peptidase
MTDFIRNIRPLPSGEIKFSLPEIQKFSLVNGLQVLFIEKKNLPIIQINLIFNAGSKFDPEGKRGLANLLSMCIDEGAGKYDSLQLSDEFDMLGTHFNVNTTEDNIYFMLQTLTENFHRSVELLADVLTSPHFSQNEFEREKRKIIIRILQLKDEPEEIADMVFDNLVFGKENPYAFPIIGYEKDLNEISVDDVKNYYKELIIPNNGALIIVGDTTKFEIENELNSLLNNWKQSKVKNTKHVSNLSEKIKLFIVDKKDAVQSEIRIGHISSGRDESDYYSKTILNMILGGQFTSRINLNLRERKGYTYGANSRFGYFKDSAYFYVSTSVNLENTANAVKEIFNELNGIRNGITNEELEFAKSSLIRKFPSTFETNKQIATNLTGIYIHSLQDDYFNSYLDKIKAVTLDEVNNTAFKSIHPSKAVVVIVGDKYKLKSQLEDAIGTEMVEVDFMGNKITN